MKAVKESGRREEREVGEGKRMDRLFGHFFSSFSFWGGHVLKKKSRCELTPFSVPSIFSWVGDMVRNRDEVLWVHEELSHFFKSLKAGGGGKSPHQGHHSVAKKAQASRASESLGSGVEARDQPVENEPGRTERQAKTWQPTGPKFRSAGPNFDFYYA